MSVEDPVSENPVTENPGLGVVYTETVVFAPPEQFIADAPYQLAIIELGSGGRLTARIAGDSAQADRVHIGDAVHFAEFKNGIPFFRKA